MTTQRIVTSQRGSWRWQDAFRIATYEARPDAAGRLRWYSTGQSGKYSSPQLRRLGVDLPHGSIHRRLVTEGVN